MLKGDRLWLPYGSRRIVVLPFCVIGLPPSGSAVRKIFVRCPLIPAWLCRKPETETL